MVENNSENVFIEFQHELDDDELLEVGQKVVEFDAEEDLVAEEKKLANAKWNARLKDVQAEKKRHIRMLRDKFETREEECECVLDYKEGMTRYFSIKTGELIKERELSNEERQMDMFGKEEVSPAPGDDDFQENDSE